MNACAHVFSRFSIGVRSAQRMIRQQQTMSELLRPNARMGERHFDRVWRGIAKGVEGARMLSPSPPRLI